MGKSNFPANDAALATPPCYTPESWAIRMVVRGAGYEGRDVSEWRKHPNRKACELSIRALKEPRWVYSYPDGTRRREEKSVLFEIWEYIAADHQTWYLHETRIYRGGEMISL